MSALKTMILAAGGLRSLVATALTLAEPRKQVVWLLHVRRLGAIAPRRLEYARKQAVHFPLCRLIEIDEPGIPGLPAGASADVLPFEPLLETVAEYAAEAGVERLIWPVQFDADFGRLASVTEQVMLLRHRLAARGIAVPRIETPLAELTDVQLLELGAVMDVPWHLAWSCAGAKEAPCGECAGCRRRTAAFAAVLLDDPLMAPIPAKRQSMPVR